MVDKTDTEPSAVGAGAGAEGEAVEEGEAKGEANGVKPKEEESQWKDEAQLRAVPVGSAIVVVDLPCNGSRCAIINCC